MNDAVFLPLAGVLLAAALTRRPSRIVWLLVAGLAASFLLRLPQLDQGQTFIGAFLIDLAVIVALGEPYTQHPDKRAWSVAAIGGCKLLATMWAYSAYRHGVFSHSYYHHYAWTIGIAYLIQVFVSGGFLDGMGRWLDDHVRRARPRFHYFLWHAER